MSTNAAILPVVLDEFQKIKKLADKAIEQLSDEQLHTTIDPDANSVAVLMRHMAGNMRSRWTDFLTTDGEKPDRQRDTEFVEPFTSRAELMERWEAGWDHVWRALGNLTDADMERVVTIRAERHSVMQAINRQVAHYAYHVGQIVLLTKHFAGANWKALTIPKKQSKEFNADVEAGKKSQR